jgi:hypothetical protein
MIDFLYSVICSCVRDLLWWCSWLSRLPHTNSSLVRSIFSTDRIRMLALWFVKKTQQEVRDAKSSGEAGFRSRCLVIANDALYRLSYIPPILFNNPSHNIIPQQTVTERSDAVGASSGSRLRAWVRIPPGAILQICVQGGLQL